jgi:hypothetical protein
LDSMDGMDGSSGATVEAAVLARLRSSTAKTRAELEARHPDAVLIALPEQMKRRAVPDPKRRPS